MCFALFTVLYASFSYISALKSSFTFFLWIIIALLLVAFLILYSSIKEYFLNVFGITGEGILLKKNKTWRKINTSEIKLISRLKFRYWNGLYFKTKEVIQIELKDGEKIQYVAILNFDGFIEKLQQIHPEFNNLDGLVKSVDNSINYLVQNIFIASVLFIIYGNWLKHKLGIYYYQHELFWIPALIVLVYIILFQVPKLFKLIKTRYFPAGSKNTLISTQNVTNNVTEDDDKNIVTNFCPICGDKLQNYKCDRCFVSLDNIYQFQSVFCIKCGTPRENSERICTNCGLKFKL